MPPTPSLSDSSSHVGTLAAVAGAIKSFGFI
jgi:hypothetical protein